MTTILVDHDSEGHALSLLTVLGAEGWLEIADLQLMTFKEAGLPIQSSDRIVWRFAQTNGMILLTNNRNMEGEDSLERVLREENTLTSLPVVTIGNVKRLSRKAYRRRCAYQLLEVVLDLPRYLGQRRVFIPFR
jgi:hypothetical protein